MKYNISQHPSEEVLDLLQPSRFRSWLAHLHPSESVGQAQTPGNDPIGNYLRAHLNAHFSVSSTITTPQGLNLESPSWVVEFNLQLDEQYDSSVRASEALEILESLYPSAEESNDKQPEQ